MRKQWFMGKQESLLRLLMSLYMLYPQQHDTVYLFWNPIN